MPRLMQCGGAGSNAVQRVGGCTHNVRGGSACLARRVWRHWGRNLTLGVGRRLRAFKSRHQHTDKWSARLQAASDAFLRERLRRAALRRRSADRGERTFITQDLNAHSPADPMAVKHRLRHQLVSLVVARMEEYEAMTWRLSADTIAANHQPAFHVEMQVSTMSR